MSFKICPILELLPSVANNGAEGGKEDQEKVLNFAHISEENFLLVLMLTNKANLAIYYKTSSGSTSRCEKVPLGRLFPKQKLLNSHHPPILVALTEDASAVCLISADSNIIFLMPFSSLLDVTWGRSSAPLATKPTIFSIFDYGDQGIEHSNNEGGNLPTAAICYRSAKAERTYLLFGNGEGALFLVDLHIKKLCLQIELKSDIKALSIFADFEADEEQKYLLINLFDNSQIVLPLETQSMQIRETFARIGAKDVHFLDPNLQYFPQKTNNSICILEKENGTLRIHNSCSLNNSAQSKFVQLDQVPSKNIQHLLVTPHFVAILSEQNRIVLHIRFLQPNMERSNFLPFQIEEDGSSFEGGNLLGIVPGINNSFNILADTHPQTQQQKHKQQTDILMIIAQTGLYRLKAENSLDGFILDHLNAQQIYSTESLAKIAESLGPPVNSPLQLCLSLLRSVLSKMQNNENQEKQNGSQIHGLLSIALSNNVELESLLKLLQEYGQTNLLIPFLCLKCERNPGDLEMRRLLLTAMLTKLPNLTSNLGRGESRNGGEGPNSGDLENGMEKAKLELEGMEMELRNFLTKFGPCDQNILPILLRAHFWQCIFILLSRDPKGHSPAMARHLLEMPTWKCVLRLDGMLLCISFLHWPSMGAFTPTLLVKLFNLVPTLNGAQLRRVGQIAETLFTKMSMESALPLKLIVSMRLLGLEGTKIDSIDSSDFSKNSTAYCPLACGPNCTVALVENAFDYGNGEEGEQNNVCQNRPMFWGEFVAGTSRMVNNEGQQKSPTKRMAGGENRQPKESTGMASTTSIRAKRRQKEGSQFPLASIPVGIELGGVESLKIICVAAGTEHILLLSADGRLFSFGRNRFGQCGIGTNSAQQNLTEICGNWPRPMQIFAGHYHSGMITENNEVWLWGWGLYGQLGNGHIRDWLVPNKSDAFSGIGQIKQICLGYAHTLALTEDGRVFGCGAISNGQLGIDPARLPENPQKICQPLQMQFPPAAGPIAQLASGYFHGLALTRGGDLFEWGECPQSLKMRMFLQKRLRAKQKQQKKQERAAAKDEAKKEEKRRWNFNSLKSSTSTQKEEKQSEIGEKDGEEANKNNELGDEENIEEEEEMKMNSSAQPSGKRTAPLPPGPTAPMLIEMPKSHLRIRRICKWTGAKIKMLSAGFNHSALLTTKGEIFTWGKSLEMQLGHGDRKEKAQPTRVEAEVKWANVICARNFTTALSAEGLIYIWGRNDRNQLGIGIAQQKPIRKILLKSEKGKAQKTVELPADNCVEKPTILTGLKVPMEEEEAFPNEEQLESLLSTADQLSINALSRFLSRYPVPAFIAVQAHLMAGDLLSAIRSLATLAQKEGLISMEMNRADENAPGTKEGAERQISLIAKVSQMSGGKNEPQLRRGIPPSTRIGTMKTTLGGGKNNEKNVGSSETSPSRRTTMGMGQSSRRVAVQMKKTYCCTSTQATNSQSFGKVEMQPPFTSTSSSSPYRLTKVSLSPSKSPQTSMQRTSSVEKNSTPSPSTFDSTTKFPNQQPKLSASSPSTISISDAPTNFGTNSSHKSMEKFYSLVDRIWNLLRIHPIREVQTMALLELLNAQFPVYNRLAADARLCRLVDNFVEFPTATSSSDSAAIPTGQRRFFELSARERQIALKKAVRPHLGSRRFQSLKFRCEQILAQDRFRYFNDCGHFEKCIVESGPSQSEMASLRNRTRQCTRCCNNSIGARRRSVESHQGRMAGANQQKGSAFGGHPQSPASL